MRKMQIAIKRANGGPAFAEDVQNQWNSGVGRQLMEAEE